MALGTFTARWAEDSSILDIFGEGLRLLRERWKVYAAFAIVCGVATASGLRAMIPAEETPEAMVSALINSYGIRSVMILALVSIFFIMPSALRRLDPSFRLTPSRFAVMLSSIVAVALTTELGLLAFVLPGVVIAVLWSQVTIGAVLGGNFEAFRRSFQMTKDRFFSTFAVCTGSVVLLMIPLGAAYLAAVIAWVRLPASLVVTLPLVLLTFVYFDCVRYAMLVRWYARLSDRAEAHRLSL